MPLPQSIPVRFTEEDADNFTIRPVKRQTFQLRELLDMILRVSGKDPARVSQILHSGTIVYHFYRYWWPAIAAESGELDAALSAFPSDDPSRPFVAADCTFIILESAPPARRSVEIARSAASRKPLFSSASLWDRLLSFAAPPNSPPSYVSYSYERSADLYALALSPESAAAIVREALRLAPRSLRAQLEQLSSAPRVTLLCPRRS
ncbi:MAG TPA: hypothetical protein VFO34_03540 [Candidatus Acidoferrales bacterium]|nr:hypothetical protein [Candidatus Acidoferrales bacterium]